MSARRARPAPPESWATIASTAWWAKHAAEKLREVGVDGVDAAQVLEPLFARAIAAARLDELGVARRIVHGAANKIESLEELALRARFHRAGRR